MTNQPLYMARIVNGDIWMNDDEPIIKPLAEIIIDARDFLKASDEEYKAGNLSSPYTYRDIEFVESSFPIILSMYEAEMQLLRRSKVTIDHRVLTVMLQMALAHVDDIKTGIEDGTYDEDDNQDLSTKILAVNHVQSLLEREGFPYQKQFPDFPTLEFDPAAFGFCVDSSWHNDEHPSFETEDGEFRLWCGWPNPALREYNGCRFSVYRTSTDEFVFSAETAAEIMHYLAQMQNTRTYNAFWSATAYGHDSEKTVTVDFFSDDNAYSSQDIEQILNLPVGTKWFSPDYGAAHTIVRLS